MSLYVVKNDKGEWLYSDEYTDWVDQLSKASFYDTFEDADDDIECWELSNAYVVELTEAPTKVVVSEEEAEMLAIAKASYGYGAGQIAAYAADHHISLANDTRSEMEDRLMRAYVNGWTVEKPKRYVLYQILPGSHIGDDAIQAIKLTDNTSAVAWRFTESANLGKFNNRLFTDAEIEDYGLQDCEKEEVTDDDE